MAAISSSEARAILPELLTRVENGEEVAITRHGRTVAVVVRPDALRTRANKAVFEAADQVHELMTRARQTPAEASPGLSRRYAEDLVKSIRAGRDR